MKNHELREGTPRTFASSHPDKRDAETTTSQMCQADEVHQIDKDYLAHHLKGAMSAFQSHIEQRKMRIEALSKSLIQIAKKRDAAMRDLDVISDPETRCRALVELLRQSGEKQRSAARRIYRKQIINDHSISLSPSFDEGNKP